MGKAITLMISVIHVLRQKLILCSKLILQKCFIPENALLAKTLGQLADDEWKNVRHSITPAFALEKLKDTTHLMDKRIDRLCSILEKSENIENGVNVHE